MKSFIEGLTLPLIIIYLFALCAVFIGLVDSLNIAFLETGRSVFTALMGMVGGVIMIIALGSIALFLSGLTIDILLYITGNKKDEAMFANTSLWWIKTIKQEKKNVITKPKEEEVKKKSDPKETLLAFIAVAMFGGFIYWLYAGLYG
tara:strand:+ start:265 stop:705 length:441 start_codon:yes stop_codon:yes gene_type:complete